MSMVEALGTLLGAVLAFVAVTAAFARLVLLPYLRDHLIEPLLERLDKMHERDGELAAKDAELEASYRLAAAMFDGHMNASELDRARIWAAIDDLRKAMLR